MKLETCFWYSDLRWRVVNYTDGYIRCSRLSVEDDEIVERLAAEGWQFVEQKTIGEHTQYAFQREAPPAKPKKRRSV